MDLGHIAGPVPGTFPGGFKILHRFAGQPVVGASARVFAAAELLVVAPDGRCEAEAALRPRTQDLDARQRTESRAARKGLVSGPAGGRDVSGAPRRPRGAVDASLRGCFAFLCVVSTNSSSASGHPHLGSSWRSGHARGAWTLSRSRRRRRGRVKTPSPRPPTIV